MTSLVGISAGIQILRVEAVTLRLEHWDPLRFRAEHIIPSPPSKALCRTATTGFTNRCGHQPRYAGVLSRLHRACSSPRVGS